MRNCPEMSLTRAAGFCLAAVLSGACWASALAAEGAQGELKFVPWPKSVQVTGGDMTLTGGARIACADPNLLPLGRILSDEIARVTGLRLEAVQEAPRAGDIAMSYNAGLKNEAYTLTVADMAQVAGADYNAVATGTVTLLQAINTQAGKVTLPKLAVQDRPGLKYCGTMLDIARKPHSIATLKQCVEAARFYKIRYIHLHMSDENAWTFPSTAFPQLGSKNFAWAGGEKAPVYKLQELKDLVAYGDARGVTFVPEMETPGHSGQMRGCLPEIFGYKTDDGKIESPGIINIASEQAFGALDTLVGEFADVFKSSPYMHIGCDEASAGGIEKYPVVKELMAKEHLKNGDEVFNYYMNRMAAIVKKHGRRMIVWTGGPNSPKPLPKDVIWMPWRGGAGELVREGYSIINPPWGVSAPYFDPYNCNGTQLRKGEPLVLGATSLRWEAVEELALPAVRYGGAQRNEPTWNPDAQKGLTDLVRRQAMTDPILDKLLNGFTFKMQGAVDAQALGRVDPTFTGKLTLTLDCPQGGKVRYTLDDSVPTARSPVFSRPLTLATTATVKARWFSDDGTATGFQFSRAYRRIDAVKHDAIGDKVTVSIPSDPSYFGPGPQGLADGLLAAGDSYGDPGWVGWSSQSDQIQITVDLKKPIAVKNIRSHFLRSMGGVGLPKMVNISVSDDGRTFRPIGTVDQAAAAKVRGWYSVEPANPVAARYVRVNPIPGAEWTFTDEVVVNGERPGPNFLHAAIGKPVALVTPPNPDYASSGIESLTDGYVGPTPMCPCLGWLGWEGRPIEATIDLGQPTDIKLVGGHFMQMVWAGVYIPQKLEAFVSNDGNEFKQIGSVTPKQEIAGDILRTVQIEARNVKARYVKLKAYGNGMWLFVDELFVNPLAEGK